MKTLISLFLFSLLFVGCSTIEYSIKKGDSEIKGDLIVNSATEINAVTKQLGTLVSITDTTLTSDQVALQLLYITQMKDLEVQVMDFGRYGGYRFYPGSKEETRAMEIDAISRLYQEYYGQKKK